MNSRGAHRKGHDQRRAIAVSGHIADHHSSRAFAKFEKLVEVPAHVFRGHDARGHLRFGGNPIGRGQELHLKVVSEAHLLEQTLPVE